MATYYGCNDINLVGSNIHIKKVKHIIARRDLQYTDSDHAKCIRENEIVDQSIYSVWEGAPF